MRDSACWRSGEITQPRSHFFGQLLYCLSTNLGHFFTPLPPFCADVIYGGPPPSPSIFCPFINALLARWRGARSRSCSCSSRRDISQRDKCCSHFTAPMSMSSLQVVTGPPYMTSAQGGFKNTSNLRTNKQHINYADMGDTKIWWKSYIETPCGHGHRGHIRTTGLMAKSSLGPS